MDRERFLGSWYVVYSGSPDGKKRVMRQKGCVVDKQRNGEWKVQLPLSHYLCA